MSVLKRGKRPCRPQGQALAAYSLKRKMMKNDTMGVVDVLHQIERHVDVNDDDNRTKSQAALAIAIRWDEAFDLVKSIVCGAYAEGGTQLGHQIAQDNYTVISKAWPAERRRVLDKAFRTEIEHQDFLATEQSIENHIAQQKYALHNRLISAARACLNAAFFGHKNHLSQQLQRLFVLRDSGVATGYLSKKASCLLTNGFAIDLAKAQVCGEIRKIADVDPLAALQKALDFTPNVSIGHAAELKNSALQEAKECLRKSVYELRGKRNRQIMRYRLSAIGYLYKMVSAYVIGRAIPSDERFQHDSDIRSIRRTILTAASCRGLCGDMPNIMSYARDIITYAPLPRAISAVLRAAARSEISWQSTASLCLECFSLQKNI